MNDEEMKAVRSAENIAGIAGVVLVFGAILGVVILFGPGAVIVFFLASVAIVIRAMFSYKKFKEGEKVNEEA